MDREDIAETVSKKSNLITSTELSELHQELINRLNNLPNRPQFECDRNQILAEKIELLQKMISQQEPVQRAVRGGNNVGQNIKKSLVTLIRKALPPKLYQEMQQRLIQPYVIKSQKENVVLFFLFLHLLVAEKKITKRVIQSLIDNFQDKIRKYISNSEKRIEIEEQRKEFHQKNIIEFQKFLKFDLDFSQQKSFAEIGSQVRTLFLRKKIQYIKAQARLKRFIFDHPCLLPVFTDLNEPNNPAKQQGQTSVEQSQGGFQNNNQISQLNSEQIYDQP